MSYLPQLLATIKLGMIVFTCSERVSYVGGGGRVGVGVGGVLDEVVWFICGDVSLCCIG